LVSRSRPVQTREDNNTLHMSHKSDLFRYSDVSQSMCDLLQMTFLGIFHQFLPTTGSL
jgi:hypothetical protein